MGRVSTSGFSGEIVYDAVRVECVLKLKTVEVFTLNPEDFLKLTNEISIK